jgi:hypothetical protein
MKMFTYLFLVLIISGSVHADMSTGYQSDIQRACMGNNLPAGTLCFEKDYTGQTQFKGPYGSNLVTVKIHVSINKPDYRLSDLAYNPKFTVVEINDTNNLFDSLSSLTVYAKATVAGYHRYPPSLRAPVQSATTLNRSYGSRLFENAHGDGVLVVPLSSNFGAEYVETLSQIEIYFPGYNYPLTIPL